MDIIHKTKMEARCPNQGHVNKYDVSIKVPSFIEVEELVEIINSYKDKKIFQEDLTKEVAQKIQKLFKSSQAVGIIMEGEHLDFITTTMYEYPETNYK